MLGAKASDSNANDCSILTHEKKTSKNNYNRSPYLFIYGALMELRVVVWEIDSKIYFNHILIDCSTFHRWWLFVWQTGSFVAFYEHIANNISKNWPNDCISGNPTASANLYVVNFELILLCILIEISVSMERCPQRSASSSAKFAALNFMN